MSFGSLLQQALQDPQAQANAAVAYDELWMTQQLLQLELLLRAGRTEQLAALLKTQAGYAAAMEQGRNQQRSRRYYYSSGFGYFVDYGDYGWRDDPDEEFASDASAALRELLSDGQRLTELTDELERLGSRAPRQYWLTLSEAYAAAGQDEHSRQWSQKVVDARLADLRGGEGPRIESDDDRYGWRWRRYGQLDERWVHQLRYKLNVTLPHAYDQPDDGPRSPLTGTLNELWEFALLNPEVETRFARLADMVGPGWGGTETVKQLVAYHRAKQQPEKTIAVLERVLEPDEFLQSEHLPSYVQACYELEDWTRLERVLTDALEVSSTLSGDVSLARLVMLRHQGEDAEASALEHQLIDACRAEVDNPHRLDQRLLGRPFESAHRSHARYYDWSPWQRRRTYAWVPPGLTGDLGKATALARALGVEFEGVVAWDDMHLSRIRRAYASHGFHDHAARIIDIELAQLTPDATEHERISLLGEKAAFLARAGNDRAAREIAEQIEAFWLEQAQSCPANATPQENLAALYVSAAFGRDYEKAHAALLSAKRLDPAIDESGLDEAGYLYELGRYAQAWEKYQAALGRGEIGRDPGTLYKAGLAAGKSGQADAAAVSLRRALWRDPRHKLAGEARELIDE